MAGVTLQAERRSKRFGTRTAVDELSFTAREGEVLGLLGPNGATTAGTGPLVASPSVHLTVAGRQTLSAGGALPVVILVPLLLGLAATAARYRVRRTG